MTLHIEIDLDNAAFDNPNELPDLLAGIADNLRNGDSIPDPDCLPVGLRDSNGNRVGTYFTHSG